jgi:hypothetical protein
MLFDIVQELVWIGSGGDHSVVVLSEVADKVGDILGCGTQVVFDRT